MKIPAWAAGVLALIALLVGHALGRAGRPGDAPGTGTAPVGALVAADGPRVAATGAPRCPETEPLPEPIPVVVEGQSFPDLQPALGDEPLPWPDDLPRELEPDHLAGSIAEVAEICGFADVLVDVDCRQPPCLAVLAGPREQVLPEPTRCEAWQEAWGSKVSRSGDRVLCADGTHKQLMLVGPWPPGLREVLPPPDPDDREAPLRRQQGRVDDAREALGCTAPSTLVVENRLGHTLTWVPDEG